MSNKRVGRQTVLLPNSPVMCAAGCIAGPKEGMGPLRHYFDRIIEDEAWGEKTWEKAESKLLREASVLITGKAGISLGKLDYIIAGDLLNQCIVSNFGLRESGVPFLGVYGACSTMAESLSIGAMLVDGGFADNVLCITSSHFCSAEKQFRFPLELGTQRSPTSHWTVTGAGGAVLRSAKEGENEAMPRISSVTTGKIVDKGIKDSNNMGAAMAPAAADTILTHFKDTGLSPEHYDIILTGDLGLLGKEVCREMLNNNGMNIDEKLDDCGVMIFDTEKQDVHSGGSGCGCSAVVLGGFIYKLLMAGQIKRLLFVATGALLSPTSVSQGESIPCIAHAVGIEAK